MQPTSKPTCAGTQLRRALPYADHARSHHDSDVGTTKQVRPSSRGRLAGAGQHRNRSRSSPRLCSKMPSRPWQHHPQRSMLDYCSNLPSWDQEIGGSSDWDAEGQFLESENVSLYCVGTYSQAASSRHHIGPNQSAPRWFDPKGGSLWKFGEDGSRRTIALDSEGDEPQWLQTKRSSHQ